MKNNKEFSHYFCMGFFEDALSQVVVRSIAIDIFTDRYNEMCDLMQNDDYKIKKELIN